LKPKAGLPVLFPSFRDDTDEEIWKTNADGSGAAKLTNSAGGWYNVRPTWNWQGTAIAFVRSNGASVHVWSMGPNGESPKDLTPGQPTTDMPVWSADGKRIIYVRDGDIWTMDIDSAGNGVNHKAVTSTPDAESEPSIASDGRILYQKVVGGVTEVHLVGGPRIAQNASQARFSPDGKKIAFTSNRSGKSNDIWVMKADGTEPVNVSKSDAAGEEFPRWSPEGDTLAFSTTRYGANTLEAYEVVVANLNGDVLKRLTEDTRRQWFIGWV
jgi:Tol biopolymer transport system component